MQIWRYCRFDGMNHLGGSFGNKFVEPTLSPTLKKSTPFRSPHPTLLTLLFFFFLRWRKYFIGNAAVHRTKTNASTYYKLNQFGNHVFMFQWEPFQFLKLVIISFFSLSGYIVPCNHVFFLHIDKDKQHPQDYDSLFCFH